MISTTEPADGALYYAQAGYVHKHPVERRIDDRTKAITLGFRVCKMCEDVGDEAAETVAALMNLGEKAQARTALATEPREAGPDGDLAQRLRDWPATGGVVGGLSTAYVSALMREAADALERAALATARPEAEKVRTEPAFAAALAHSPQPAGVPAGHVVVPVEPSEAMIAAGWIDKEDVSPAEIWHAMVRAAAQQSEEA